MLSSQVSARNFWVKIITDHMASRKNPETHKFFVLSMQVSARNFVVKIIIGHVTSRNSPES